MNEPIPESLPEPLTEPRFEGFTVQMSPGSDPDTAGPRAWAALEDTPNRFLDERGFDFIDDDPIEEDTHGGHGLGTASVLMSAQGGTGQKFVSGVAPRAGLIRHRSCRRGCAAGSARHDGTAFSRPSGSALRILPRTRNCRPGSGTRQKLRRRRLSRADDRQKPARGTIHVALRRVPVI